jgi:hypothetical protein
MSHLAQITALQQQVELLTRQLEGRGAVIASPAPIPPAPTVAEARPIPIASLHGRSGQLSARELRQHLEAIALSLGAPSPARDVPAAWMPYLKSLETARAKGLSWSDALLQAGLRPPDVTSALKDLQRDTQALERSLPGLVRALKGRVHGLSESQLYTHLGKFFT